MKQFIQGVKQFLDKLALKSYNVMAQQQSLHERLLDKVKMIEPAAFEEINYFKHPSWSIQTFSPDIKQLGLHIHLAAIAAQNEDSLFNIMSRMNSERIALHAFFLRQYGGKITPDLQHFLTGVNELAKQVKLYHVDFNQRDNAFELMEIKQDIQDIATKTELVIDELLALQMTIRKH